jgi:hypothetical protein
VASMSRLGGVVDRGPRAPVRRRARRPPVRRAGGEQCVLVREVAVDGRAADAGPFGDRADRGLCGTEFLRQGHGALGDPSPCLVFELGAAWARSWATRSSRLFSAGLADRPSTRRCYLGWARVGPFCASLCERCLVGYPSGLSPATVQATDGGSCVGGARDEGCTESVDVPGDQRQD